jgi:hypothetical protein
MPAPPSPSNTKARWKAPDDSPVQGLKLAYVGPDTSYLLYSGLWFPVAGYGVNRFTSTINVTVPAHMVVIGSGKEPSGGGSSEEAFGRGPLANSKTFTFTWDKPSFPGTIIAGTFQEFKSDEAGIDLHVFFKPNQKTWARSMHRRRSRRSPTSSRSMGTHLRRG